MSRRLDHIVRPTDEPEPAVPVEPRQVAREVPPIDETSSVARFLAEVTAEHRGPTRSQRDLTNLVRRFNDLDGAVGAPPHNPRFNSRNGPAHGSGQDVAGGEVGD